jgi:hypothetical protein
MSGILSNKDVNAPMLTTEQQPATKSIKSMEYHRQILHSKMEAEKSVTALSSTNPSLSPPSHHHHHHQAASSEATEHPPLPLPNSVIHNKITRPDENNPEISHGNDGLTNTALSSVALRRLRQNKQYISPSDNIMSPCTAKLNALRNKQVGK